MPHLLRSFARRLRPLWRQPGFACTAVAVLTVGIGANVALFTIVDGLLLQPIVPDHPERLVSVYSRDESAPDSYRIFSHPNYLDIAADHAVFADVLAHSPAIVGVAEGTITRRVFADVVTANFFSTLGAPLAQGRAFTAAEASPDADIPVTIVSDSLFNRLGRPADVLTRSLRIDGRDYTIVGVARPGFTGTTALASPELWLPLGVFETVTNDFMREGRRGQSLRDRTNHTLFVVGRLQPWVSLQKANADVAQLAKRMAAAEPAVNRNQELLVNPVARVAISSRPPNESGLAVAAALLLSVAGVVLVIACLNVATLLLSRGVARRREIAIRLALGASRSRVVGHLLFDGLVLAVVACALGVALGYRASRFVIGTMQALAPLPLIFDGTPDARTLLAAVFWTGASTLLFALGPAWRLTRTDVIDDLQLRSTGSGSFRRWFSGHNLLGAGQLALSLALLTTAMLFLRGAVRTGWAPLGFTLDGQVIATVDPALGGFDAARARQLDLAALDRIRSMPGVSTASLASTMPFGDIGEDAQLSSTRATRREDMVRARFRVVGRDYFQTLGLPVQGGRTFSESEETTSAGSVAVIDTLAAARLWPGTDPLGRTVFFAKSRGELEAATVVGVVSASRDDLLEDPQPILYRPYGADPSTMVTLHARFGAGGAMDASAAIAAVRTALHEVDPALPVLKVSTLAIARDESPGKWIVTTSAQIFGAVGLLASLLAVVGLYAVISYSVSRRVKEIGIRTALGATGGNVLAMVLFDGAVVTGVGLAIGAALSAGAAAAVRSAVPSIVSADVAAFTAAPALLCAAAFVAAIVPARKAARLEPSAALRHE